jgi:hypothetical protein
MKLKDILNEIAVDKNLSKKDVKSVGTILQPKTNPEAEVNNLSFKVNIKNMPITPGILLHQVVEIGVFDLPDNFRKQVKLKPYHILFGDDSVSLYNAFGVTEVGGLSKKGAEDHISNMQSKGKTEKDDAFIGGLVNFAGSTLFQFFNMQVLGRQGMRYRLIPHESLHVARNLISLFENPKINPAEDEWWENPEYTYTDLKDASEEFFAEVLERATEIAFTRYDKIKNKK